MACLNDEHRGMLSNMLSRRLSIKEEQKQEDVFVKFPFEKVFPVCAMGLSSTESDPILNFPCSGADPMWDAVRQEAKLEVLLCCYLFIILPLLCFVTWYL